MGNRGKREFIQAPRLIEVFPETLVAAAALDAIRLGAFSFDAVKQLVIAKVEHRPANLDLSARRERQDNLGRRLYGSRFREGSVTAAAPAASPAPPQILLAHHLRQLKLPTFLANMKRSPQRRHAKVSIMSASCCVSPNSNSSIAKGAWSSAASAPRIFRKFRHVRLHRHSIAQQAADTRTRALRISHRPRQCYCSG
jgi:hypothetical protein